MMNDQDVSITLRLSAQRALLGAIPWSLRAVTVGWEGTTILMHCIFDGEISDEDKELLSIAATEIIADFSSPYTISFECIRHDSPNDISSRFLKDWIYIRYEERTANEP